MAAGESRPGTLRYHLRQPLVSLRLEKVLSSITDNPTDVSDAYSDSGSEYNEGSRNVVQWLQSLPADHQWCEAEEQVGRLDSSEVFIDEIPSIGDSDAPITLKSQACPGAETLNVKKVPRDKKYRRGALHANSLPKEPAKTVKKSKPSHAKRGTSKKLKKFPTPKEVAKVTDDLEEQSVESLSVANKECSPVFDNPEFGKMLDETMTRAINKYKRNERTWDMPLTSKIGARACEPPPKKSKDASFQFFES